MSRTVFVSACGDPFLLAFVIKLFKERWYNEVDKMWINYNNHAGVPQEVVGECLKFLAQEPKVELIYHPRGIGNGMPITEMTKLSQEDLVMLLEDDGFIFEPGIVNRCFQEIEVNQFDAVGSPRFSCGAEIGEASKIKYGLDYSGYGDVGPNYWPNFFFCKRSDLLRTDMNFASKTFKAGEFSPELNWTFKEVNHGDTFVWSCIQLRALGLRFKHVPQHHASPTEPNDKKINTMNWSGEPMKWIHGGSLSAGWGGYLSGVIPDVSAEISKLEIESRVAFWKIVLESGKGLLPEFAKEYEKGITNLITNAKLEFDRIESKVRLYRELMRV